MLLAVKDEFDVKSMLTGPLSGIRVVVDKSLSYRFLRESMVGNEVAEGFRSFVAFVMANGVGYAMTRTSWKFLVGRLRMVFRF